MKLNHINFKPVNVETTTCDIEVTRFQQYFLSQNYISNATKEYESQKKIKNEVNPE